MKTNIFVPAALLSVFLLTGAAVRAATLPAGHWEGAIKLPGTELAIRIDLTSPAAADGAWAGTIDIPAQGLRGYTLTQVAVEDAAISFALPNIPGDPAFTGQLAADGATIAGSFTQGGQTFPFQLARAPAAAAATPTASSPLLPAPAANAGTGIVGAWLGALDLGGVKLRLAVNVREQAGQRVATLDSIDQGANGIPVTNITDTAGGARLELKGIGAVFEGTYRADGAELAGTWSQGGRSLPLVLQRQEKPFALSRPQEPKPPHPYREEEVTFRNEKAGITLAGTLTLPAGTGPHPAVVLVSGSGPQDRDESLMGHKPFLVLADHLTRAGLVVLRYDDRGAGRSEGQHFASTHVDFADDARAALEYVRTRAEVDPQRTGLLGHSEGGVHVPLAAAEVPGTAFMVFLAGVGVPVEELLERQSLDVVRAMGLDYVPTPEEEKIQDAIYDRMRNLPDDPGTPAFIREKVREGYALVPEAVKQALGLTETVLDSRIEMMLSPWFMRLAVYDPRPALTAVDCPVLALNGDKDVQVAAEENLAAIKTALTAGGNRDVTVKKFPGLNHLFQHCTTGAVSEYGLIEETMSPEVLATVSDWIREKTGLTGQ